ncbi:unnamed protein product [Polarella glacialis]|uniref:Reverse transcriptase domain-containing protein n=1 Tax=Polarella glacialis TaxID=89957 RepID=A0A813HPG5_POLGL|nr:unnamed protein product [Polarella glacialis]
MLAMKRFGIPDCFIKVIRGIYSDREFVVRDAGSLSSKQPQHFGICQGCPLSPFLFAVVMTILMHDAKHNMTEHAAAKVTPSNLLVNELLYADDTLIVDVDAARAEQFMHCIGRAGSMYGFFFNWRKLEILSVRCEAKIAKPDGSYIAEKDRLV